MIENGGKTMAIVSYTIKEMRERAKKVDLEYIKNLKDEDIVYDEDSPEITAEMMERAVFYRYGKPVESGIKIPVSINVDNNLINFFKSMGENWENNINMALLEYAHSKSLFRQ